MTDFFDFGSLLGANPADLFEIDRETVRGALLSRIDASRPNWMQHAQCRVKPLEWFYPTRGRPNSYGLECCGRCLVRQQCLDEALGDPSLDYGIRGGMTEKARRARRQAEAKRDRCVTS